MSTASTIQNPLGYERIVKLMLRFAIPSIVSLVFNSIYNIVDQVFIGQRIGYLGNGATNVIYPLTVLGIALAVMYGYGSAAFISLNLGRGNKEEASKGAGNAIMMASILGIVLCVTLSVFLEPICYFLGATELVMPYALEYGRIIVFGFPFFMFAGCGNSVIRADGRPRLSMLSMLVGAITNIILDPIFIFVFGWGMAGVAWATIIGQFLSAVITFSNLRTTENITLSKVNLRLRLRTIRKVAVLGISSTITQAAAVIIITMFNVLLTKYGELSVYGAEIPLAAHGITMKVNQIVTNVCIGLASGCQPIIGFNYAAKQYNRVRMTTLYCFAATTIVLAIATVVYQIFPMSIVRIFGSESELYNQYAVMSFRIFLMTAILHGFHTCTSVYLQAVGKPGLATINALTRQIIFMVPAALLLGRLLGVEGILWSGPASDTMAFVIAFILMIRELRHLKIRIAESKKEVMANE